MIGVWTKKPTKNTEKWTDFEIYLRGKLDKT